MGPDSVFFPRVTQSINQLTLFIHGKKTRISQNHEIVVNVVKGQGYEPILCKQTLLDMKMVQILDCDREPRVSTLAMDQASLLDEYSDVFEGLGRLEGTDTA